MDLKILTANGWYLIPVRGNLTQEEIAPHLETLADLNIEVLPPDERVRILPIEVGKKELLAYLESKAAMSGGEGG